MKDIIKTKLQEDIQWLKYGKNNYLMIDLTNLITQLIKIYGFSGVNIFLMTSQFLHHNCHSI